MTLPDGAAPSRVIAPSSVGKAAACRRTGGGSEVRNRAPVHQVPILADSIPGIDAKRHGEQSRRVYALGFRLPRLPGRRSLTQGGHNVVLPVETTRSIMGAGGNGVLAKGPPFICRFGTFTSTPAIVVCPVAVYT